MDNISLVNRINAINNSLSSVDDDGNIITIIDTVESLNTTIDTLNTTISNININLTNINTNLSNINTNISNIDSRLSRLNEAVLNYEGQYPALNVWVANN